MTFDFLKNYLDLEKYYISRLYETESYYYVIYNFLSERDTENFISGNFHALKIFKKDFSAKESNYVEYILESDKMKKIEITE